MSDCQEFSIREQLPEYLHGALDDAERARVLAHVEWCVPCAEELAIMQAVVGTAPAPTVDIARIVAAIPPYRAQGVESVTTSSVAAPRLSLEDRGITRSVGRLTPRRSWYANTYMRVAAGFLLAAVGVSGIALSHHGSATVATPAHVQGAPAAGVSLVGVSDLSDGDLEQLIQSMDNLDASPPADPDPDPGVAVLPSGGSA